ncbi:RHS repeat-associated core domain-containing protein, partial [Streptomyces sp. NPDC008079]|uniref:RHS repeat-associated core domain-containing protein n=1 Tax=Streptomyces sp. NPDC008079 TaxID=3364806 RepID=UPI0036EA8049
HTTHRTWDPHDNLLTHTDPLGHTTTYTYDTHGNPTHITHPNGTVTRAEFDGPGRPVRITTADGAQWSQTYDASGNALTTTDPVGAVTVASYDGHGGLREVTDALGHRQRFTLSPAGLPLAVEQSDGSVTRWERDAFGRVVAEQDPLGGVMRLSWTVEGRMTSRTLPDGAVEHWAYDGEGNLVEHRDALGAVTHCETAPFDRVMARTGPDGARTAFRYDTELRLVEVLNAAGSRWRYRYDPAGRLTEETDFNGRTVIYERDAAGRVSGRTNGAGERLTYERDAVGRLVAARHADGTATTYAYDPVGRLVRADNDHSSLLIERDLLGAVVAETVNGRTVQSRYDVLGRRVERVTPAGRHSVWNYGATAQPHDVTFGAGTLSFSYDAAGRERSRTLTGAFTLDQSWDPAGRLSGQTVTEHDPSGSGRTGRFDRAYAYRPDGRLTGQSGSTPDATRDFRLDAAGRVAGVRTADGSESESYTYDPLGNISSAAGPVVRTAAAEGAREVEGTLLRHAGRSSYAYDEQGRVVRHTQRLLSGGRRVWEYRWDAEDRMTGVTTPDGSVWRYLYDALGRRIAKQQWGDSGLIAETVFVWDGARMTEEVTGQAATTWEYAPGTHRPLAQIDERFYAIVTDLIGAPSELIGSDGDVAWRSTRTVWDRQPAVDGQTDCPLRFPGQYADAETGLHYNHLRYYDPVTARYQSPDPLGLVPAPNHHTYVENPYDEIDPFGLSPCTELGRALKPGEIFIYRAVQAKELAQLLKTRRFENVLGIETKYFSTTMEGAAAYARAAFKAYKEEGPYTLVRSVIHKDAINPESLIDHLADAGGGIDALALSVEEMAHAGRVRILPFMPLP